MCEHKDLEIKLNFMQDMLKDYKQDAKEFRDEVKADIKSLTTIVTTFIEDVKETNITRKEAEDKFTQKQSFRVGMGVIGAVATLIGILSFFIHK